MQLRTVAGLALVLYAHVGAAQTPDRSKALEGLRSVTVQVLFFNTQPGGAVQLDTVGLRVQTELELKRAGISVEQSAAATLSIAVLVVGEDNGLVVASRYDVMLQERVSLAQRPATGLVLATTWQQGGAYLSDPSDAADGIAELVHQQLAAFLNDYLTANPPRR